MKKLFVTFNMLLATALSFGQNTFPSTGDVGVGTSSPTNLLTVQGTGALGTTYQLLMTDGSSHYFKLGESSSGSDLQSAGGLPMFLNYGGNNVIIGNGGAKIGVNTGSPTNSLTFSTSCSGIAAYNTTDQITNYERIVEQYQSNVYTVGTYFGGTGTAARAIQLGVQPSADTTTLSAGRTFTINPGASVNHGNFDFFLSTSIAGNMVTLNTVLTGAGTQQNMLSIQGTVDQTSSSGYTGLLIAPYEQTTGSGTAYLIDAGTNSAASGGGTHTSVFNVDDHGNTYVAGTEAVATTTIPSGYVMAINGNAIAGSVTVQAYTNWPDYVFKPNYRLMPLADLGTYVSKYRHLPGLPAATEVAATGLNLGETDKTLVKKVEELALYLVEKDKQLKEQQAEIKAQNEKIAKLQEAVDALLKKR